MSSLTVRCEAILLNCVENESGCWVWQGYVTLPGQGSNSHGYGLARDETGRKVGTHRLVYRALVGEIPDGYDLDHLCRTRACCNPSHLEPVTRKQNVHRGEGLAGINARKTHCIRGHEFAGHNLRITPSGNRVCRACQRIRMDKHLKSKE